ncbi:MAG: arsinothricin resistance N-acetyltransferase ArsN1 family B [bacterium]
MLIRPASVADAAAIAAIYAPYVRDTPISFEVVPPTADEIAARIEKIGAMHGWLVCADRDDVLGYAYTSPHAERAAYRWGVDCAVYVHGDAQRRGIGGALYTALFRLAASQGCAAVYAGITLPNPGSVALHERAGFVAVGVYRNVGFKLGAWHDVGWWALELGPRAQSPAEPHVASNADWQAALAAGNARLQ